MPDADNQVDPRHWVSEGAPAPASRKKETVLADGAGTTMRTYHRGEREPKRLDLIAVRTDRNGYPGDAGDGISARGRAARRKARSPSVLDRLAARFRVIEQAISAVGGDGGIRTLETVSRLLP